MRILFPQSYKWVRLWLVTLGICPLLQLLTVVFGEIARRDVYAAWPTLDAAWVTSLALLFVTGFFLFLHAHPLLRLCGRLILFSILLRLLLELALPKIYA